MAPVPAIGIGCCVRPTPLAEASIQGLKPPSWQGGKGRQVKEDEHSQLAFAEALNLF